MESNYLVKFTVDGEKQIRKLDKSVVIRIMKRIVILKNFKSLNNIKQMNGGDVTMFRWRLGDLRIIFEVDEKIKTVWVVDMGFRGGVYRGWCWYKNLLFGYNSLIDFGY